MPVNYGGSILRPAPLVTMQKTYARDEYGRILHPEYAFTLQGTIVNVGSSLDSPSAQSYGMDTADVLAEQERLRNIFIDGELLEITSPNHATVSPIQAYCTVESVDFSPSTWTNRCDYVIQLKAKKLEGESIDAIDSFVERWSVNENEDGTFSISHELQAVGSLVYESAGTYADAVESAKTWCNDRRYSIGTNGALNLDSGGVEFDFTSILSRIPYPGFFWNYSCVEGIGISSRGWQLTENFICASGNTRESWSASVSSENNDPYKTTVSINGTVIGYADNIYNYEDKSIRAKSYFDSAVSPNIYTRLTPYIPGGYTLNPIPTTKQVSYEKYAGTLNYSFTYTAVSGTIIPNAIDEAIAVSDVGCTDVFAQIPVPGRAGGPVTQYMATTTLPERTVSINATMMNPGTKVTLANLRSMYLSKPNTNSIVDALKPEAGKYYVKQDTEEWNPIKGQYGRVVSWTLAGSGSVTVTSNTAVSGIPTTVHSIA